MQAVQASRKDEGRCFGNWGVSQLKIPGWGLGRSLSGAGGPRGWRLQCLRALGGMPPQVRLPPGRVVPIYLEKENISFHSENCFSTRRTTFDPVIPTSEPNDRDFVKSKGFHASRPPPSRCIVRGRRAIAGQKQWVPAADAHASQHFGRWNAAPTCRFFIVASKAPT